MKRNTFSVTILISHLKLFLFLLLTEQDQSQELSCIPPTGHVTMILYTGGPRERSLGWAVFPPKAS